MTLRASSDVLVVCTTWLNYRPEYFSLRGNKTFRNKENFRALTLSTPVNLSEATWKKATKCNK